MSRLAPRSPLPVMKGLSEAARGLVPAAERQSLLDPPLLQGLCFVRGDELLDALCCHFALHHVVRHIILDVEQSHSNRLRTFLTCCWQPQQLAALGDKSSA